jgi:hypothetical protein
MQHAFIIIPRSENARARGQKKKIGRTNQGKVEKSLFYGKVGGCINITWPSKDLQMNRIKTGFYDIVHFPGVEGAIDCTHVRIQAPPLDYEYAFVNRKGCYSKSWSAQL